MHLPIETFALVGAELYFLINYREDIIVILKKSSQRTEGEKSKVKRGLRRALLVESFIFVPASALLMTLIIPLENLTNAKNQKLIALYSLLGIASYKFPFAAIRGIMIGVAKDTIRNYMEILAEDKKKNSVAISSEDKKQNK